MVRHFLRRRSKAEAYLAFGCGFSRNILSDTNSNVMIQVLPDRCVDVFDSYACTFFAKEDGSIWAVGTNSRGETGLGYTGLVNTLTEVTGIDNMHIFGGAQWSNFGIKDGSLFAAGYNGYGQLGLGDGVDRHTFTQIGTDRYIDASSGREHSLAIREDGRIMSVGSGAYGSRGDGATGPSTNVWGFVSTNDKFKKIAASQNHSSYGLREDGVLFAWGYNGNGQLGLGGADYENRTTPIQVGTDRFIDIKASTVSLYALREDRKLFACGGNSYGQLGLGDSVDRHSLVEVPLPGDVFMVDAAGSHVAVILMDRTLWTCGMNNAGQLGLGDNTNRNTFSATGIDRCVKVTCAGATASTHVLRDM